MEKQTDEFFMLSFLCWQSRQALLLPLFPQTDEGPGPNSSQSRVWSIHVHRDKKTLTYSIGARNHQLYSAPSPCNAEKIRGLPLFQDPARVDSDEKSAREAIGWKLTAHRKWQMPHWSGL